MKTITFALLERLIDDNIGLSDFMNKMDMNKYETIKLLSGDSEITPYIVNKLNDLGLASADFWTELKKIDKYQQILEETALREE